MSEQTDNDKPKGKALWLLNIDRAEQVNRSETRGDLCSLNDYSQFETFQMVQAMDSEDRI